MPLTFFAASEVHRHYDVFPPDDVFTKWEWWRSRLSPWEVVSAVEGLFDEHNPVTSVVHFRGLVTQGHSDLRRFWFQIVGRLVVLFQRHKHPALQCEVAHTLLCMENIWAEYSYSFQLHVRVFVESLSCTNLTLRECGARILQPFWNHEHLLKAGTIKALYRMACSAQSAKELETAVITLSTLLRCHCRQQLEFFTPELATFVMFLYSSNPKVVYLAADALHAMRWQPCLDAVLQAGVLPQTVHLLRRESTPDKLFTVLLEIVRNIARGSERHIQALIDHDLLRLLHSVLKSNRDAAIACGAIANICAGSQHQLQQVIDLGVFRDVVEIMRSIRSDDLIRAAISVLANATNQASSEQMQLFVDLGCVQLLSKYAFGPSFFNPWSAFHGLRNFLKFGATHSGRAQPNPIARLVKEVLGNEADFKKWHKRAMPEIEPTEKLHELVTDVLELLELCGVCAKDVMQPKLPRD